MWDLIRNSYRGQVLQCNSPRSRSGAMDRIAGLQDLTPLPVLSCLLHCSLTLNISCPEKAERSGALAGRFEVVVIRSQSAMSMSTSMSLRQSINTVALIAFPVGKK